MEQECRQKAGGDRDERGFSLLETMIAMVMLAIGLLAIAAMQDIALSRNVDAKRLSIATSLAAELIERVRYNSPANATAPYPYNFTITCTTTACTGGTAPTTTNVTALGDYNQWRARLGNPETSGQLPLPNATATVTSQDLTNGPTVLGQVLVTVTLSWESGIRTPTISMSTVVAPL